jgi:hypothetical protein
LEELEQEELEGQLLDVETPSAPLEDPSEQLPDVPTHVPVSRKKVADEDDDLRELAAWATS